MLRLTTTHDLSAWAHQAVGSLRAAGIAAEGGATPAGDGADVLRALREGGADAGIVPLRLVDGWTSVAAVLRREGPADVLVTRSGEGTLVGLAPGSSVGVAGRRRRALLAAHRPDLIGVALENGRTPAQAFEDGVVDQVIMDRGAARRLGLEPHAAETLDAKAWLPAAQQGALAVVVENGAADAVRAALNHAPSRAAVACEGALVDALEAWDAPLGVLAQPSGPLMRLWAMAASSDGRQVVRGDLTGAVADPDALARSMARLLVDRGVREVLAA